MTFPNVEKAVVQLNFLQSLWETRYFSIIHVRYLVESQSHFFSDNYIFFFFFFHPLLFALSHVAGGPDQKSSCLWGRETGQTLMKEFVVNGRERKRQEM